MFSGLGLSAWFTCAMHSGRVSRKLATGRLCSCSDFLSPTKGVNKEYKEFPLNFAEQIRVLKFRFLAFPGVPGGFRELREAGRNHLHLSWYLLVLGVTRYDQKTNKEKTRIETYFYRVRFFSKNSLDAILAFPGLNSYIQVKIP